MAIDMVIPFIIYIGFGRFARAGSCALVCVVHNNKVYTANAGDSLSLLIE